MANILLIILKNIYKKYTNMGNCVGLCENSCKYRGDIIIVNY